MRKIRYGLMLITLLASLSGFTFFGPGSSSLATMTASHHVTASSVAGKSGQSIALIIKPYCPDPTLDC